MNDADTTDVYVSADSADKVWKIGITALSDGNNSFRARIIVASRSMSMRASACACARFSD